MSRFDSPRPRPPVTLAATNLPAGKRLLVAAGVARSHEFLLARVQRMDLTPGSYGLVPAEFVGLEWYMGGDKLAWGDEYRVGKWVVICDDAPRWQSLLDNPEQTFSQLGLSPASRQDLDLSLHVVDGDTDHPMLCVNGAICFGVTFDPVTLRLSGRPQCICAARSDSDCCCTLSLGGQESSLESTAPDVIEEVWECRQCGDLPCRVHISFRPTEFQKLEEAGRLATPTRCICGVPKRANFRPVSVDDYTGTPTREWSTIRT